MGWLRNITIALSCLVTGIFIGIVLKKPSPVETSENRQQNYPLLARRLFVENPNDILINFTSLRTQVRDKLTPLGDDVSFYFEYMPTGTAIRVSGENQLVAASLIKLPLVMNLYHADELGTLKLDDTAQVTSEDLDPAFGELYKEGAGQSKTLREFARITLTQSDNTAYNVLSRTISDKLTIEQESLRNLDIDYDLENGQAVFSARSYSSILKCLYFSCYLNYEHSQELLDNLTNTSFNNRITAQIPAEVKVAHKFGKYTPQNIHSDCGIFYIPKRQYILCIMVHGDENTANQLMSDTSKTVYDWVVAQ